MSYSFDDKLKNLLKKNQEENRINKEKTQLFHQSEETEYRKWADFIKTNIVPVLETFSQNVEVLGWKASLDPKYDTLSTYQVLLVMKKDEETRHLQILRSDGWNEILMLFVNGESLEKSKQFKFYTSSMGIEFMQDNLIGIFKQFYL